MEPWVSLLLFLAAAGAVAFLATGILLALVLLRPPRMTDGKAIFLLQRLTPADLQLAYEPLSFEARDQANGKAIRLAAWWIPNAQASETCAVLIHGRADSKTGAIAWAPLFQRLGMNVLAVDLRAHGESGGRNSTCGYFERHDVEQILTQARQHCGAAMSRIVLVGLSLGSAVALATAELQPYIAGVILDSTFSTYRRVSLEYLRLMGYGAKPLHWLACTVARWISGADFDAVDPARLLQKVRCPVLMICGGQDPLFPPDMRRDLETVVTQRRGSGLPVDTWTVSDAGHLESFQRQPQQYEQVIRQWLADRVGMHAAGQPCHTNLT
jgi:uncharacterized protein